MKFELEESLRGVTNEELLEDLRRAAKAIGKETITTAKYEKVGKAHPVTIQRRFGSWAKALEQATLKPSKVQIEITDEELHENIKSLWMSLGRQPRRDELKAPNSRFHGATYFRRFGSFPKALRAFVDWVNADGSDESQHVPSEKIAVGSAMPPVIAKRRTRREISDRQRFRILVRDGFRCKSCGKSPSTQPGIELHVDHVLHWSKGGETIDENLESKCKQCNLGKGNAFDV
jgi:hypothetical protein